MRRPAQIDAGLQRIADWQTWFVEAHTQRLTELHLPADQHDRELAAVTAQARAIADHMRAEYEARTQR